MGLTAERLQELQAKHGRVKHVVYNGVDLVFRAPSVVECEQHAMANEGQPNERVFSDRLLSQLLIVVCGEADDPMKARTAYGALLEAYPYAWRSKPIGEAIGKLTGIIQDDALKGVGLHSAPNGTAQTTTPRA